MCQNNQLPGKCQCLGLLLCGVLWSTNTHCRLPCPCRVRVGHAYDTCQTRPIRIWHESTHLTRPTRSNSAQTYTDMICGFVGSYPTRLLFITLNPQLPTF